MEHKSKSFKNVVEGSGEKSGCRDLEVIACRDGLREACEKKKGPKVEPWGIPTNKGRQGKSEDERRRRKTCEGRRQIREETIRREGGGGGSQQCQLPKTDQEGSRSIYWTEC